MIPPEEAPRGAPDWLLTYADMVTLLLAFFVLLVSMSELRSENRVVQAVEAMNNQFGHDRDHQPGSLRLRGSKVNAPLGTDPTVRGVRTGRHAMVGGMVLFDEASAALDEVESDRLKLIAQQFVGKAQKIEVRGHTTKRPLDDDTTFADHWDLAYARCREVLRKLTELGIEPGRIRMSVAADSEPSYTGDDPLRRRENSRVEVFLLNEFNSDYENAASAAGQEIPPITVPSTP
ncbi:MAG: OmpA family protein [Planctomycetales bacterium]|nr:OmpA family protein [Planctomycetales bacterium]